VSDGTSKKVDLGRVVLVSQRAWPGASEEEYLQAWQTLVDTGLAWQISGFDRTARDLIQAGLIRPQMPKESPQPGEQGSKPPSPVREVSFYESDLAKQRVRGFEQLIDCYENRSHEEQLTDLLADAKHWAESWGTSFEHCLKLAEMHYQAEGGLAQSERQNPGHERSR
jgi:hypothetical protein